MSSFEQNQAPLLSSNIASGSVLAGRYTLDVRIGQGGFGQVWRAHDRNTGQVVAVKLLNPFKIATPEEVEVEVARFEREMQLVAKLKHPNVIRLIDSGRLDDGMLYAVLEYVEGEELRSLIDREGPLPPREAKRLLAQVLDALCSAHAQGVVHRDIKPANIMITSTGGRRNAMVLDFGIGSVVKEARGEDFRQLTVTGLVHGTPSYMAPEQLKGQPITPSSDVYSWGIVFIETLSGKRAINADSAAEVIAKQLSPEPLEIPSHIRGSALEAVLLRATAKPIEARFATAHDALEALENADIRGLVSVPQVPGAGLSERWTGPSEPAVLETAPGPTVDLHGVHGSRTLIAPPVQRQVQAPPPSRRPALVIAALLLLLAGGAGAWLTLGSAPPEEGSEKSAGSTEAATAPEAKPAEAEPPVPAEDPVAKEAASTSSPPQEKPATAPADAEEVKPSEGASEAPENGPLAEARGLLFDASQDNLAGRYSEAIQKLGEAIRLAPEEVSIVAPALVAQAHAHHGEGELKLAKEALGNCVERFPESSSANDASALLEEWEKEERAARRAKRKRDQKTSTPKPKAVGVQELVD